MPSEPSAMSSRALLFCLPGLAQGQLGWLLPKPIPTNEAGLAYLAQNNLTEGVSTLPSGLQIRVLASGLLHGDRPAYGWTRCVAGLLGTYINGTSFATPHLLRVERPSHPRAVQLACAAAEGARGERMSGSGQ